MSAVGHQPLSRRYDLTTWKLADHAWAQTNVKHTNRGQGPGPLAVHTRRATVSRPRRATAAAGEYTGDDASDGARE